MYGPLVLAGRLGAENLTRAMMYGEYDAELKGDPVPVADIAGDPTSAASWVDAVPGEGLAFRTRGQAKNLPLVPLSRLFGERYAVYWKVRPPAVENPHAYRANIVFRTKSTLAGRSARRRMYQAHQASP